MTASKWVLKMILCLAFLGLAPVTSANAQSRNDRDSIQSFVDSVAGTVYNLAWPTATYRRVSLDNIMSVTGGYDVEITLYGTSFWDDSSLWLELTLELRDDGLHDIRLGRNNAILAQPFQTVKAFGQALSDMQKQYDRDHPRNTAGTSNSAPTYADDTALPPAAGACLANSTTSALVFSYHFGTNAPASVTLQPGETYQMAWSYGTARTAPVLSIDYDSDFAPGYQGMTYDLPMLPTFDTKRCAGMAKYHFETAGTKVLLFKD